MRKVSQQEPVQVKNRMLSHLSIVKKVRKKHCSSKLFQNKKGR